MPAPAPVDSSPAFRYEPPNLAADLVSRADLAAVVAGRFERRLTVLVAGPGFGKTTLLAQAALANRLTESGIDAWLRLDPADQDPQHLISGLARALTGSGQRSAPVLEDLVSSVWSFAPQPVALVLDDAHHLGAADPAWRVLAELLESLPANGHLVIAGRSMPRVPVRRMQADDVALVIDEDAMAFTAGDLEVFARTRGVPPELLADLPTWPALAVLTAAVGHQASAGYLWDEVVSGLEPGRRALLARAALFDVVDDDLIDALAPGEGHTTARLVDGLPLVDADRLGSVRLHALWADALRGELGAADRRDALLAGAESFLARRQFRRAVDAFADAGDADGLKRAVRRFATQPIARVDVPDVVALLARLPPDLRVGPVGRFLDAATFWATSQTEARAKFGETAQAALDEGDLEIESLARWREVQLAYLDDHSLVQADDRTEVLAAAGVPLGSSTRAFVRSVQAQCDGRIADALAALDEFDGFDPEQRLASTTSRLIDLGRPEAVSATLDSILGPDSIDAFGAQALWLRGDIDPETGWAVAGSLAGVAGRKGVVHEQVSIKCVVATVALAAGADRDAARLIDEARESISDVGGQVGLMVDVASALLALSVDGEAAARDQLERAVTVIPLGRWPARAYLHGLTALRALVPAAAVLDDLDLGPALQVAVDAGRAVDELRSGVLDTTRMLPWDSPSLLRAHVPPSLLVELALGRSLEPGPAADLALDLLARVPGSRRALERLAARGTDPVADAATARLATLPQRPAFDLYIDALGPLVLRRSDGEAIDDGWMSRERVRQLLVRLLLDRRINRSTLAIALWPDLPADRAAANLRVNLRHLQRVLQPERPTASPPWFVRSTGTSLQLAARTDGLEIDVDRFDELIASALRAEAEGMPSVALAEYQSALALYRGDLLSGIDDPQLVMERMRLRSVAHGARCRCGELTLARGDAGGAMRDAAQALELDPLSERAHRLVVRSHLAMGSTSAARSAATRLVATLEHHRLRPDDETRLLLARLDL